MNKKQLTKLLLLTLAFAGSWGASAEEEAVTPSYAWKALGGGVALRELAITNAVAFLFDANTCSQSNLVALSKAGNPLAATPFVIGNVITNNATIPTSGTFTYGGEAAGAAWTAYFALRVERGDKTYLYISTPVATMGTVMDVSQIAFESQASYAHTLVTGNAYAGPGWYEIQGVLAPSSGVLQRTVTAASEQAAIDQVTITGPGESIVSNADYAKYFKITATRQEEESGSSSSAVKLAATPTSEGVWLVRAELDAEKIEMDKTVSSLAADLPTLSAKGGAVVTVEVTAKPGLYYRVLSASSVAGPYEPAAGDKGTQATGSAVSVPAAAPEGGMGFFKIEASPKAGE